MPTDQISKLQQETHWNTFFLIFFTISALSGFVISLPLDFSTWFQINLIGHTLAGSLILIPSLIYLVVHFKRTVGVRRPLLIFSGLFATLLFICAFTSGVWLALEGHTEKLFWVIKTHQITTYLTIFLALIHVISHIWINKEKKKNSQKSVFITLGNHFPRKIAFATAFYCIFVALLSGIYFYNENSSYQPVASTEYSYDYGDHPFRPSQTETLSGNFIKTEQIAKSNQCGGCHQDIYQQWLSSTHRQAASDPAYVKNVLLLEKTRGITATRYCEGCHAPVALLTGELTPGGKHGGIADTPANLEGVGCLGCHGISRITHLNGTASYEFDPKEHYMFDSSASASGQKIRNYLIRLKPDAHKQAMSSDLIDEPKLCASCHEQFMDKSMNNWGWVKMQSTYNQWLSSPFSGQNSLSLQSNESLTCQNCHFPLIEGNDPSADKNGFIHSHRSPGANTMLPTLNGDIEQLNITKKFLQSSRLLVDVEEPNRKDTVQNHEFISQELISLDQDNTPFFLYLGEQTSIRVSVTNHMIGHTFPTGTTDLNQAWLYFKVSDANGHIIYESGSIDEDLILDKSAHTYHAIPVDRQGKHVWRHDLFRMIGNSYKNVIPPGKSDIKEYTFDVPAWATSPLSVVAIVKYRKFNQQYASWALNHPRPVLPIVDMARDSLTIPLRVQPIIIKSDL